MPVPAGLRRCQPAGALMSSTTRVPRDRYISSFAGQEHERGLANNGLPHRKRLMEAKDVPGVIAGLDTHQAFEVRAVAGTCPVLEVRVGEVLEHRPDPQGWTDSQDLA